ncbi:MAG: c-type cytochrome [Anaerolineales bacterium]|nr:c-type cytochrome [Anaerolineales bacterium]
MSKAWLVLAGATLVLTGCSLAGDVTPPPALATEQAIHPSSTASVTPQQQEPSASSTQASGRPQEQPLSLDVPDSQPDLVNGERIYAEKCADCHGPSGLGDGAMASNLDVPPPSLGDPLSGRKATLSDWYTVVTVGRMERFMPPFSSLSDSERFDVAAYALTLSIPEDDLVRGERVYLEQCANCHGVSGVGGEGIPNLANVSSAAQRSAEDGFAAITNGVGQMPAYADVLSAADRWAAARYAQTLSFIPFLKEGLASQPSQSIGTIQGHIVNATIGETVPEGLEVTLVAIDAQAVTFSTTTSVDDFGDFTFEDLELQQDRIYVAYVDFQGVRYVSEGVRLREGASVANLPLSVYESTSDTSELRVERLHLIYNLIDDGLAEITEIWLLRGPDNRTIAGADGSGLLEVFLPAGFDNLSFSDVTNASSRYRLTEVGFLDLAPIQPGEPAELVFSFTLPFSRQLDFAQRMNYPVDAVVILLAEGASDVKAENLQDLGVQDMGGVRMRNYAMGALAAGDVLRLNFSSSSLVFRDPSSLMNAILGASVLGVVLLGVGYWWSRRGRMGREPAVASDAHPSLRSLLQAIAALDDEFEAGSLSEAEYRPRREALKRKALAAMRSADD